MYHWKYISIQYMQLPSVDDILYMQFSWHEYRRHFYNPLQPPQGLVCVSLHRHLRSRGLMTHLRNRRPLADGKKLLENHRVKAVDGPCAVNIRLERLSLI